MTCAWWWPRSTSAFSISPITSRRRPTNYYLGQRRLTAEIRDLYGQLIDGMQGVRGAIRTGGDVGAGALTGSPPVQPPLALYSGIVKVGDDGIAHVQFTIPAFAGTVRVMAVGWSKDKVGHASRRRHRARSGGADGDAAALPAYRRQGRRAARARQRRGRGRRLQDRGRRRGHRRGRRQHGAVADACRKAARPGLGAGQRPWRRAGHGVGRCQRAQRLQARTRLCAQRAAGDANPDPAQHPPAGRGREPDARPRHVRRLRARHRPRRAVGRRSRPRSMPRPCSASSTAIRSAAPSRSPARRSPCSTSTSSPAKRISPSTATSTPASATPSSGCWRGRTRTARSGCGRSAATTSGSTPMSPTS